MTQGVLDLSSDSKISRNQDISGSAAALPAVEAAVQSLLVEEHIVVTAHIRASLLECAMKLFWT